MAILATLIGCQGAALYKELLPDALSAGITPVEVKEIVYQATAYLGIGRTYPFLKATNEVFEDKKIPLPLSGQSTTNPENRLIRGSQTQVEIFGQRRFWQHS